MKTLLENELRLLREIAACRRLSDEEKSRCVELVKALERKEMEIIVDITGGLVANVKNDTGIKLTIRDYDVQDTDDNEHVHKDEEGKPYYEFQY